MTASKDTSQNTSTHSPASLSTQSHNTDRDNTDRDNTNNRKSQNPKQQSLKAKLSKRFRGFYPVVVDIETAGFNAETDALLEIAAITTTLDDEGNLVPYETLHFHIEPFENANLEPQALAFNGIDPFNPLRQAVKESVALTEIFQRIRKAIKLHACTRAILVGHNTHFDQGFLKAAIARCKIKRDPFHPFSTFDTVSMSALLLGHTVLAKSCQLAQINFDEKEAHSALYDANKTAELFFFLVNNTKMLV